MKYIIIIGDGMADWPIEELSGKTPLEAAKKPNMDFISKNGKCGLLRTLRDGMPFGSDIANLSILGYEPGKYYSGGRGPIEAASMGLKLGRNDIAFRCNLITEENGFIRDYSGGHISTEEAEILIKEINKKLGTTKVQFYPGKSYRHILILKDSFSEKIRCMPPHDIIGQRVDENLIKVEDKEGEDTAEFLNKLILESKKILENHTINKKRIKEGKSPANMIWLWGAGKKPRMPKFREKFGINGALISAVDLLNGIAIYLGMEIVNVSGATGYIDTNYEGKADAAIDSLKRNDLVYVHVESIDEMSHEGNIKGKIKAIEDLDKRIVGKILDRVKEKDIRIAILPDHATPIKARTHTSDPVPFAIYSKKMKGDNLNYDENSAKKGSYGLREGTEFMKILLS